MNFIMMWRDIILFASLYGFLVSWGFRGFVCVRTKRKKIITSWFYVFWGFFSIKCYLKHEPGIFLSFCRYFCQLPYVVYNSTHTLSYLPYKKENISSEIPLLPVERVTIEKLFCSEVWMGKYGIEKRKVFTFQSWNAFGLLDICPGIYYNQSCLRGVAQLG